MPLELKVLPPKPKVLLLEPKVLPSEPKVLPCGARSIAIFKGVKTVEYKSYKIGLLLCHSHIKLRLRLRMI